MASIKDVEQVADDLEKLVGNLRSELQSGADFERLVQIADEISEHADQAAETFSTVNDTWGWRRASSWAAPEGRLHGVTSAAKRPLLLQIHGAGSSHHRLRADPNAGVVVGVGAGCTLVAADGCATD